MNKLHKKVASVIASGALLLNAVPAFAGTTVTIQGNGAGADNFATVNQQTTTTVTQSNNAFVVNNVDADADSGYNQAKFNTGGDVTVGSGNAKTDVSVSNTLNSNTADVDCCEAGDTEATIQGNGAYSLNNVDLTKRNNVNVDQDNYANVVNDVDSDAVSGHNRASSNTGGDTAVVSGNARANVDVSTTANTNTAHVGNASDGDSLPSATFTIRGNGAGSANFIDANLAKRTTLDQDNVAYVVNDVDADADSGFNKARFNTGGEVLVGSGNARAMVGVDNTVNFNHADIDCGCTWDVTAKIAGNGAEAYDHHGHRKHKKLYGDDNVINLGLSSAQVYGQDNYANLLNEVEWVDANSGHNKGSLNTGDDYGSDPWVVSGDATVDTYVENNGNVNTIGDHNPMNWDWPDWDAHDWDVDVSFNLHALLGFLGLSMG